MARYQVVKGSQTAHCCFEATVVDTATPLRDSGDEPMEWFEDVCECLSVEHAEMIAKALNATSTPVDN